MKNLLLILILLVLVASGCKSPTKTIAEGANQVGTLAQSSKERFENIDTALKTEYIDEDQIRVDTTAGIKEQETIILLTKSTLVALTKVEDEVPWWASLITYTMVTLSILAICFVLWYTGLGTLLKGIFYSFGLFIPKAKLQQAELARKALDDTDPATPREMVAVMRSSDPVFNAAFNKLSKKETVV